MECTRTPLVPQPQRRPSREVSDGGSCFSSTSLCLGEWPMEMVGGRGSEKSALPGPVAV